MTKSIFSDVNVEGKKKEIAIGQKERNIHGFAKSRNTRRNERKHNNRSCFCLKNLTLTIVFPFILFLFFFRFLLSAFSFSLFLYESFFHYYYFSTMDYKLLSFPFDRVPRFNLEGRGIYLPRTKKYHVQPL